MAVTDRVLTGTRLGDDPGELPESLAPDVARLVEAYAAKHPGADPSALDDIRRAAAVAAVAHAGQRRKSGEPYVHHPIAVATIVAELGLDVTTIVGAPSTMPSKTPA